MYTDDALAALDRLWGDEPDTAGHIEDALDALETDPADARCRAVSLRAQSGEQVWGMPVRTPAQDWLILWHYRNNQQMIVVLYIGPNFVR